MCPRQPPEWDKEDSRTYEIVNRRTGESFDRLPILVPRRARMGKSFVMAVQEGLVQLAKNDALTHDAKTVLLLVLGCIDFENHFRMSQADVAERLGIDKSRVSRAFKLLLEHGVLAPSGEKVGRVKFYRLNPAYGWKGKVRNLNKAIQEAAEGLSADAAAQPTAAAPSVH